MRRASSHKKPVDSLLIIPGLVAVPASEGADLSDLRRPRANIFVYILRWSEVDLHHRHDSEIQLRNVLR